MHSPSTRVSVCSMLLIASSFLAAGLSIGAIAHKDWCQVTSYSSESTDHQARGVRYINSILRVCVFSLQSPLSTERCFSPSDFPDGELHRPAMAFVILSTLLAILRGIATPILTCIVLRGSGSEAFWKGGLKLTAAAALFALLTMAVGVGLFAASVVKLFLELQDINLGGYNVTQYYHGGFNMACAAIFWNFCGLIMSIVLARQNVTPPAVMMTEPLIGYQPPRIQ